MTTRRKTIFGEIKNADELLACIKSYIPDEDFKLQYHRLGINLERNSIVSLKILETIKDIDYLQHYMIGGIYLNKYTDGKMYAPMHNHRKQKTNDGIVFPTHQFIISLGGTRMFKIGKKEVNMKHGDTVLFGTSSSW